MNVHIIPTETRIRLMRHVLSNDYEQCCILLTDTLDGVAPPEDGDLKYELGAAYVQLSVYHLICNRETKYKEIMGHAKKLLPEPDQLALAAIELNRSGKESQKVRAYCLQFFSIVDDEYLRDEPEIQYWFDTLSEILESLQT